jgi:hypothetical protein
MPFSNHTWLLSEAIQKALQEGLGDSANVIPYDYPLPAEKTSGILSGSLNAVLIIPGKNVQGKGSPEDTNGRIFEVSLVCYASSQERTRHAISDLSERVKYWLDKKRSNDEHWFDQENEIEYLGNDSEDKEKFQPVKRSIVKVRFSRYVC